ncbi:MAG: hemagglutinin repeat-containing protein, partial [Fusobacteriaceae bacterium]|nr:hemagglutinin repeat-containing protein [Fusobacteriaceae bacterium]
MKHKITKAKGPEKTGGFSVKDLRRRVYATVLLLLFQTQIFAGIVPDPITIGTRATRTATGIDQVDIARPNANGASYNAYKEFDVDEKGLILNNNIYIVVDTKLAGLIARNRNLDGGVEAKLIINDVTGAKASQIKGIIEIGGARADVVIANRNGLNINGGGFINVGNATLTTGRLVLKDGDLAEIEVDQGRLDIGSKGIDATSLESLDLSGKTVGIGGPVKGSERTKVRVSAGAQNIQYKTKKVTSKGKTYEGVAIDGKALGSMYSGKIDVISNDKGAGVNLQGDLISLDDMTLTSAGSLTTSGSVRGVKKVRYKAQDKVRIEKSLDAGEKAEIEGATIELAAAVTTGYENAASDALSLEAAGGNISNSGDIEAFGVAKLSGTSLDNSGNIVTPDLRISATELANSGAIQAAAFTLGADSLSNSGLIQTSEINLGANKLVNSGLIGVEKGIAASGKTFFNTGLITTPGALHLTYDHMGNIAGTLYGEKAVALEGLSLDNTDGVISTLGKLTIDVKDLLNRYGVVYTDGALTIATADLLDNTGGILVGELDSLGGNKLINEEGQILTNRALTLASLYTDNTKGEIFTPESITVSGDVFINDGGYLHTNKGITVNVSRASNREGFILSDGLTKELLAAMEESPAAEAEEIPVVETAEEERETAAYDGIRLMSNTLDNTKGTIRSLGDLVISADTTNDGGALTGANIDYTGNMSNKNGLVSGDAIVLKGNINNSAGSVSGDVITVKGNISGNSGGVLAGDVIEISGNTNNNGGEIQGNEIAFADGSVTNASGKILGGAVTADANIGTFNNDYGFTQGLGYVNLTNVSNAHGTITSDYSVSIANSGNLNNNYGIIEAKSADYGIEITAGGTLHNESGSIKSPGTVFVNTGGALVLDERIQGNTATSLAGSVISVNKNLYRTDIVELTARNGFALNGSLDAKQLSLNTGVVVTVNHALNGREGLYINAQSLTNTSVLSSGTMVALRLGEIKTKKVTNEEGNLVDEEYVDYKINNKLFNNGTITSQKDIYIAAGEMYNEEGHAISAPNGSIVLEGINLYNTGAVSRAGNSVSVGNGGQIKGKEVYISLSGSLINGFRDPGGLETRTDGTLKDNRTVSGGAVGAIAGTQTTNVSAGNVENRGNIGIAGSGTTFVGATGRIVNEKIGNYAGGNILGFDVYVDGNGGVVNTGALIRGTNSTSVRSLSGTILNQTTVKDGEIWFSHKEESATDTFIFYPNGDEIKKFAKAFENAGKEFPGMSGYFSKINLSDASYVDVTDLLASVPADVRAEYQRQKAAGKSVRIVAAYAPSQEIGGENGGSTTPWYSFQVLEAHEVVDLTGEGLNNIGTITSDGLVWLEGNNIENIGGLIAGNAGTTLEAKNDINDRSIAIGYRYSGSDKSINDGGYLGHGDWDVASGISNISGRIGAGGSTSLLAGRDINLVNSEIAAAVNAIFYADRYLNSLAVYDTVYRYDYDEWTEGGRLNRKKYKETFIVNNKLINGTEIVAGGNILFNMGLKDENGVERANKNRGVYLEETLTHATNGSLGGKSLGNIYVEGGLNSLYSYHQRIKKRSGISKLFGDAYDERTENSQEIYSLADIYSKKDIVYASDGKLTIKGADIYAEGSIHLSGKKGVSILPGTASSYYMEYLKKSGWTSSFSIGKGGISVGVGYAKSKSKYEQWNFDVIKSVIRADGDFIVVSEEGNYEQISTDINVKGNASITAKDIIIGDMASTVKIKQEQSSSYMGIGLSIGMPIVSTALALVDAAKNPERKMGGLNTVTAAVQARKAYNDFQSAANAMMLGGNYFAVNLSLSFSKNKSKYQSEAVNSVGSALNVGGNLTINGDNLHVTGSKIDVKGNIDYSILGNILVEAGRNAFSESSKSSGFSLGFSTNALDKENNFNPIADKNGILQLGYSTNKSWADGVNWNVSTITAGGNTNYNVGGDVIYKGAVVTTGSVSGTIGGNLYTETLQDYFNGGQKGYSLSVGIGFGKHKERGKNGTITESDNPYLQSLGVGYVTGHTETKLSNNPTKFTANG